MRNNTVTAVAGDNLYIKTASVFQYDYGLKLVVEGVTLPEEYDVHFCNTNNSSAKTVVGDSTGVMIPDEYLRNGEDIHAYIYLESEHEYGYSVLHIHIPVADRAAISEEELTPIEHDFVKDALKEIAEAVDETETNVTHYPYISDDEYWMVWDADNNEFVNTGVKAKGDNTYNLDIGTVTTLPPGSQATASITWDHGDAKLNLGLPVGDTSDLVSIHDERFDGQSISIHDGADDFAVDDLRIRIIPTQEGSGTPSTRNIRRITGVTGVQITHNEDVYNVSFEDVAGTVYGGTYYPLTWKLVVDRAFITKRCVDMDNLEIQPGWNNSGISEFVGTGMVKTYTDQMLNVGTSYSVDTTNGKDLLYMDFDQYHMRQYEWKNTEITVQICIELTNPVEYDLSPIAIATVLGNNTFAVDTGKISYLKYPCDTKKYIDHKIAEVQALVLEN